MTPTKPLLSLSVVLALVGITVISAVQTRAQTNLAAQAATVAATQAATAAATRPARPAGVLPQSTLSVPAATNGKDVGYAPLSAAQKLDLYVPSGTGPFPLVIYIHGGAFKTGDKSGVPGAVANLFLSKGYAVASLNYRLSSEAIYPAQIQDVKAAVRWLRANAATFKLNPDQFAAWGASAGGNLAAMLGTSGDVKEFDNAELGNANVSSRVQAVIDQFGPIDFLTMDAQFTASGTCGTNFESHDAAGSPESLLVGGAIQTKAELVKTANPTTYISKDDPAFFIQHGDKDCNIPLQQSELFSKALAAVIGADKVTFEVMPGAGHGGAVFDSTANAEKLLAFLDKYLK
jgi:acetyl esterase/lipase